MEKKFKAKSAYTDNNVVANYDSYRFTSLKGRLTDWLEKRTIEKALKNANIESGSTLIDIPCGTGRLSLFLAGKGMKMMGTDISSSMVDLCRRKAQASIFGDALEFQTADAESLPFESGGYDNLVSLRLFGHVPPEIRVNMLKEFKRVTRGPLILAYYHAQSLQCALRKSKREKRDIPWYPVTYKQIEQEISGAGMRVAKIVPMLAGVSETLIVVAER